MNGSMVNNNVENHIYKPLYQKSSKGECRKAYQIYGHTRGVEKLPDGIDNKPTTQKQRDLICECITAVPEALMYPELKMYQEQETRYTATEFLDAFIERNADRIDGVKKLVQYYGERQVLKSLADMDCFRRQMIKLI